MGVGLLRRRRVIRSRATVDVITPPVETPLQRVAEEPVVAAADHSSTEAPKPQAQTERRGKR